MYYRMSLCYMMAYFTCVGVLAYVCMLGPVRPPALAGHRRQGRGRASPAGCRRRYRRSGQGTYVRVLYRTDLIV